MVCPLLVDERIFSPTLQTAVDPQGPARQTFAFDFASRTGLPRGPRVLFLRWARLRSSRSMFESNFPVDKVSYSYPVFWNACKLLAKGASNAEKADLFGGTAARFYRLDAIW